MLNAQEIKEAKSWLMDCVFADVEPEDIEEMTDSTIVKAIARHYDGGIPEFCKNCGFVNA
jgi:hypothetical protein